MPDRSERYIVPRPLQPYTLPFYRLARRVGRTVRTVFCRVNPRPVLVLGNQKSGTTAIAALLAKLTGRSVTLDLDREIEDPTYEAVRHGARTMDHLVRRNKFCFSRQIVKEPHLTPFARELMRRFPEAPVVFVVRDPRDNTRSILNRLDLPGDCPELPARELAHVSPAWRLVLDNRWLGVGGTHYIEQLAGRWRLMAETYLAHARAMTLIRYEDFLRDKAGAIQHLAAQLHLESVADIRGLVDVQFQPRGDHGTDWRSFFGNQNLERIERICQPVMPSLGYHASPREGLEPG